MIEYVPLLPQFLKNLVCYQNSVSLPTPPIKLRYVPYAEVMRWPLTNEQTTMNIEHPQLGLD